MMCAMMLAVAGDAMAQRAGLLFEGVPLGLPLDTFCLRLTAQGYSYREALSNTAQRPNEHIFHGTFGGEKVVADVYVSPRSHRVYKVGILFKELTYSKWTKEGISDEAQRGRYREYKAQLAQRYGSPTKEIDFLDDVADESAGDSALMMVSYPMLASWHVAGGIVILATAYLTPGERELVLFYVDQAAAAKDQEEKSSDL